MSWWQAIVGTFADAGRPTFGVARSPEWSKIRAYWLSMHPRCAACGATSRVVPHHVVPVHADPSLELDLANLISLCEHPARNCHLMFGHALRWDAWNEHVRADADHFRARLASRRIGAGRR